MILYRPYNHDHVFLSQVFLGAAIITVVGTTAETIMVMTIFGMTWSKWDTAFRVTTPILHVMFTLAQIHGSRILFALHWKQKRLAAGDVVPSVV